MENPSGETKEKEDPSKKHETEGLKNKNSEKIIVKKLKLTNLGLQNINTKNRPLDFTFIVDGKEYKCQSFFADFISPVVARNHAIDPCMNRFVVNIKDPKCYFKLIVDTMHGFPILVSSEQREFIKNVAIILGNTELLMYVQDITVHNLNSQNALSSLEEKLQYGIDVSEEIDCIAEHFYKFNQKLLAQLDINILKRILFSPKLVLDSESSLFRFIMSLVKVDHQYASLFSSVVFCALSNKELEEFRTVIKPEDIDSLLLEALKSRLLLKTENLTISTRYIRVIHSILFKSGVEMFNGIANFLRKQCNGNNPVTEGLIKITIGVEDKTVSPRELFERKQRSRWNLPEKEDNFICLDFIDGKVALSGYSWASGCESSYWEYPVSYTWEGSNDLIEWTLIDKKKANTDMDGNESQHHWECPKSAFFRYIRFRLNDVQRRGGLYCTQLEIFGDYLEPKITKKE